MPDASPNEPTLHVGQLNPPNRAALRAAFDGIFDREYYTNHGPLVREFERRIETYLGVSHAICTVNGTAALMVAVSAMDLSGDVVTPAFTFPATAQALSYAGLTPVFCDIDPVTHSISPSTVAAALTPRTSAILGVHMWGRLCDVEGLSEVADRAGAKLMFDAAHAFGCGRGGRMAGRFGAFEVFSFHATKILNCTEGGCITTDDDALADAFRTARNFHEQETFCETPLRINAKMSEAQAAFGILALDALDGLIEENRARYERYRRALADIAGVRVFAFEETARNNFQYVVAEIDEDEFGSDRDVLMDALKARGVIARRYFSPGMHQAYPYDERPWTLPETDRLCTRVLQVPSGAAIDENEIDRVVGIIVDVAKGAA